MTCEELQTTLASDRAAGVAAPAGSLEHLESCDSCRSAWLAGTLLEELPIERQLHEDPESCPPQERLLGLADGSLAGAARLDVVAHVDACTRCLRELAGVVRDLEGFEEASREGIVPASLERSAREIVDGPSSSARRWVLGVGTAAGLVLVIGGALLLRAVPTPTPEPEIGSSMRRGDGAAGLEPIGPRGVVPAADELAFRWIDAGSAGRYRLVVADLERGSTVLERVVGQATSYVPTAEERQALQPGRSYHWLVEPLGVDDALPSPATRFRLER